MRRVAVLLLLISGVALAAMPRSSRAESTTTTATLGPITNFNGTCYQGPYNTVVPCFGPAVVTTRAPIVPLKDLAVSGPAAEPAGTSRYTVNITSQLVCFTPSEPIFVYTYGQSQAAALSPIYPTPAPVGAGTPQPTVDIGALASGAPGDTPQRMIITPGPGGTSALSLEVFNAALGEQGLGVAAAWPEEGILRSQQLVAPSFPAGTAVAEAATATPGGTPAPTATAGPHTFPLRACVSPSSAVVGAGATLYVQTAPGATCAAAIRYSSGVTQPTLGGGQVAGSDGFAVFPFTVASNGTGTVSVSCSLDGITETTTTTFTGLPAPAVVGVGGTLPARCAVLAGPGYHAGVQVSDQHPRQNEGEAILGCFFLNGTPVPAAQVNFVLKYINNTAQTCSTFTDITGSAECVINISNAPVGYPVSVSAFFTYQNQTYTASTTFTVSG